MKGINLIFKRLCVFLMAFAIVSGVYLQAYADTKYENWETVANEMTDILNESVEIYKAGGDNVAKETTKTINKAYFQYYEKLGFEKTVMSYISGKRGSDVENKFYLAKKAVKEGKSPEELKEIIDTLTTMLKEDAATLDGVGSSGESSDESAAQESAQQNGRESSSQQNTAVPVGKSDATAAFSSFITAFGLTMREGLEAILVIAAIIAYLVKTDNKKYLKGVYLGALLGIGFSIILAAAFNIITHAIGAADSGMTQEIFEGIAMFVAVAVLFYVSNWMLSKSEAEVWSKYIKSQVEKSIGRGNMYALAFASFLAVFREGAELILFFQAMIANGINTSMFHMWLGIIIAAVCLAAVYIVIVRFSVRLPLKPFFMATSILMFILCISFAGKGVYELQEADVIGRTVVGWMNGFSFELLGIYDRVETLVPQVIVLILMIVSLVVHSNNNKKMRAKLEKEQGQK